MDPVEAASLFAALADPTRLGIVRQLAAEGPTCVCNLSIGPPTAPNLLSYHLKVLREAGLVTARRRGRWIDYSLSDGALDRLRSSLPRNP
jgi:ArsR family transcriptional regulator